jgi:predicted RNase H-like HicB family nuclease
VTFTVVLEEETDGRWIAEVPELAGTLVYGASPQEATAKVKVLALSVLADRLEHGEADPALGDITFAA